jgi:hypothetical protein
MVYPLFTKEECFREVGKMNTKKYHSPEERKAAARSTQRRFRERLGVDGRRHRKLRDRYRMTPEQYSKILEAQNGVCAICKQEFTSENPAVVDHDHVTGKVRGLLHSMENSILGFVDENPVVLRNAAEYLEKLAKHAS